MSVFLARARMLREGSAGQALALDLRIPGHEGACCRGEEHREFPLPVGRNGLSGLPPDVARRAGGRMARLGEGDRQTAGDDQRGAEPECGTRHVAEE